MDFKEELIKHASLAPPIYSTSNFGIKEVKLWAKFIVGSWKFFVAEFDKTSLDCFGYVEGFEKEWGGFNLNEIVELNSLGYSCMIQANFQAGTLDEINARSKYEEQAFTCGGFKIISMV